MPLLLKGSRPIKQSFRIGETIAMKDSSQHLIAKVQRRQSMIEMTIGIDLGDVWSHDCTLNQEGEVVDRGRFRTTPTGAEKPAAKAKDL
jgi:hypothetical protein